jgi:metal-dependent amidase/aminoacylase/carboxypeptidase family protein
MSAVPDGDRAVHAMPTGSIGPSVDLGDDVRDLTPRVIAQRRRLHQYPELAFEEVQTAATLAARMGPSGCPSRFLAAAPGCLMLLGTANPAKGITEVRHRPGFDIGEAALPIGVHVMSMAALDLLG